MGQSASPPGFGWSSVGGTRVVFPLSIAGGCYGHWELKVRRESSFREGVNLAQDWQLGNFMWRKGDLSPDLIGPSPAPVIPARARWLHFLQALQPPCLSRDSPVFRFWCGLLRGAVWSTPGPDVGGASESIRFSPPLPLLFGKVGGF